MMTLEMSDLLAAATLSVEGQKSSLHGMQSVQQHLLLRNATPTGEKRYSLWSEITLRETKECKKMRITAKFQKPQGTTCACIAWLLMEGNLPRENNLYNRKQAYP